MENTFSAQQKIVIIGGGPGGYEAAITGAQLGAEVTLIERVGIGGSAVLSDVVPSKTLIATADAVEGVLGASDLGVRLFTRGDSGRPSRPEVAVDLLAVNSRLKRLARAQSDDMHSQLTRAGVTIVQGYGRLNGNHSVVVSTGGVDGSTDVDELRADTVIVAVGASPRELETAKPDGERILTWKQLYDIKQKPEHLIVVGSGVTGAEFASAYTLLGSKVTLISSREHVLPGEDADAAAVIEEAFERNGMTVLNRSRAESVVRDGDRVIATLSDGSTVEGSHCLMAVGSIPNTAGLGLEEAGVELTDSGHIRVNRVSRTSRANVYAVGDCSAFFPLASVAAMQGRTAVYHALGDSVAPIDLTHIASNIFTSPEIATVGLSEKDAEEGAFQANIVKVPLSSNPRAKMLGIGEGFVKILSRKGSGSVMGAVIVAPRASELILPLAIAVEQRLTVDQISRSVAVYPSLTGAITTAAASLHDS